MIRNLAAKAEIAIIILLASVPLLIHFPYRVNIFLSWEGAYRMSRGQLPFRDFGTPLGGMYWVIPAIFFKLFGPKMITLVKAQVLINILSGLAFRSILKSLSVQPVIRLSAVLLFCLSYSFFNFWPWYNHSVIVYELLSLACLFKYIAGVTDGKAGKRGWLIAAGVLAGCSFLTKQDGGGMAVLIALGLLTIHSLYVRKAWSLCWFGGGFLALMGFVVILFGHAGFGYWFNHGQPPHTARVSIGEIVDEVLAASQWIKFYIFLIGVLAVLRYRKKTDLQADPRGVLLVLLTIAILGEAAVFQVTSYTPPDNNIFFHAFAIACIFSLLVSLVPGNWERPRYVLVVLAGILLWWSGVYWKYLQRVFGRFIPAREMAAVSPTGENIVNRSTYMINLNKDSLPEVPMDQWVECGLPAFSKISMPPATAAGIKRIMEMDLVKQARMTGAGGAGREGAGEPAVGRKGAGDGPGLKVLNMSELTPLAAEIPYALERNPELPLWFHLGVGMFNKQAVIYENRVRDHYYDLVLFEYVPTLNNFYPFRVRDSLRVHYQLVDKFEAPRRGDTRGVIEVYAGKKD